MICCRESTRWLPRWESCKMERCLKCACTVGHTPVCLDKCRLHHLSRLLDLHTRSPPQLQSGARSPDSSLLWQKSGGPASLHYPPRNSACLLSQLETLRTGCKVRPSTSVCLELTGSIPPCHPLQPVPSRPACHLWALLILLRLGLRIAGK